MARFSINTMPGVQGILLAELNGRRKPPLIATLASLDADGAARARSVVVRGFDAASDALWLSTHIHAQKSRHLLKNPEAELVLWLPQRNIQLRFLCTWRVIDAGIAARIAPMAALRNAVWQETSPATRGMFEWPEPGAAFDRKAHGVALPEDRGTPPASFALLYGVMNSVDALHLKRPVHLRMLHEKIRTKWVSQRVNP